MDKLNHHCKTGMNFRRKISPFERLCVANQNVFPPLANQFVIEGLGTIDKQNLQIAIAQTAQFCPGTRLILEGKHWIDSGTPPPVHEIILENFNGYNFEQIPRLWKSLDDTKRFTCEVLLIHSKNERANTTLIFRSSHGVMDGRGTLHWAEEVFRVLRNEEPVGAQSEINDMELVAKLVHPIQRRKLGFHAPSPLSVEVLTNCSFFWKRHTIPGQHPAMVAKLAEALNNFSTKDNLQFMVPVDLRRHDQTLQSTACLSLPIFLSTQKGEAWQQIRERLLQNLAEKKELALDGSEWSSLNLPLRVLAFFMRLLLLIQKFRKKYLASAILSNIGKIKLNAFTVEGFIPKSVYALPVHNATVPLFFVITQCPEHLELMVSCSCGDGLEQEVDELLNQITSAIYPLPQEFLRHSNESA